MRYVLALGKMPEVINQGHGVHGNDVNQILVFEASRKESKMNSESLGQYYFGQPKTERANDIVASNNHQVQSNSRCAKGVCEVAWKPSQASITSRTSIASQAEQPKINAGSHSD